MCEVTLARRFKSKQVSHSEAASIYHRLLADSQEKALLDYMNNLTFKGFSSSLQILRNLVEETLKSPIEEH